MERQTYTNTNRYLFLFLIALMVSRSKNDIQIAKSLNKEITIYPDYKDVTIPVNIAPLNFSIADSSEHCLIIKGEKTQLQVYSDEGLFEIPQKRWKALLKENAGNQIELTIAKRIQGEWNAYTPFHMDIVNDSIDKYIAYRLLALSNDMWNRMGIYQRNLENYDQSVIYENSLSDGKTYPLSEANSAEGESYHSWSHNNRWLVFSSRRLDGLYTRPFFTYIDDKGTAHKPFLLPQRNPVKYYKDLLWTYNLPEFIQEKVQIDTHAVMETMRNTKGVNVR